MSSKTIQIIGSLNIDLITRTPRHPTPGETLTATSFTYGPGGKGANQAVACARLSRSKNQQHAPSSSSSSSSPNSNLTIKMTGAVGSDFFGTYLLDSLSANSVDITSISQIQDTKTGTAVIIVEESTGENRILITPGANGSVSPESIQPSLSPSSPTSLPDLIILQLEIPLSTVVAIIELARDKGVDVLLNPAPAVPDLPRDVYKGLKHLIMNESEAAILSSSLSDEGPASERKREMGKEESGPTEFNDDMQDLCERFHALGVVNVIVTLGAKGVYYSSRANCLDLASGKNGECGYIPAAKVEKVVDTTAAGDTFVGAYAVAVVRGERVEGGKEGIGNNVEKAIQWANKAAAKTVEREGSMGSIPWRDEVGEL